MTGRSATPLFSAINQICVRSSNQTRLLCGDVEHLNGSNDSNYVAETQLLSNKFDGGWFWVCILIDYSKCSPLIATDTINISNYRHKWSDPPDLDNKALWLVLPVRWGSVCSCFFIHHPHIPPDPTIVTGFVASVKVGTGLGNTILLLSVSMHASAVLHRLCLLYEFETHHQHGAQLPVNASPCTPWFSACSVAQKVGFVCLSGHFYILMTTRRWRKTTAMLEQHPIATDIAC